MASKVYGPSQARRKRSGRVQSRTHWVQFRHRDGTVHGTYFHTAASAVRAIRGWTAKGGRLAGISQSVQALRVRARRR